MRCSYPASESGPRDHGADMAGAAGRWPLFVPVALEAGFRSAHAFPLRLRGRVLGALNLFRTGPGGLARAHVAAAQALTDVATITIVQHRAAHDAQALAERLHRALDSRIVIEQAKGLIAEQAGIGMDGPSPGFAATRRHRRLLAEVALDVVERRIRAGENAAQTGRRLTSTPPQGQHWRREAWSAATEPP